MGFSIEITYRVFRKRCIFAGVIDRGHQHYSPSSCCSSYAEGRCCSHITYDIESIFCFESITSKCIEVYSTERLMACRVYRHWRGGGAGALLCVLLARRRIFVVQPTPYALGSRVHLEHGAWFWNWRTRSSVSSSSQTS